MQDAMGEPRQVQGKTTTTGVRRLLAQGTAGVGSRDGGSTGAGEGRQRRPPSTPLGASCHRDLPLPAPRAPGVFPVQGPLPGQQAVSPSEVPISRMAAQRPFWCPHESLCATLNAAVRFRTFYWGAQFKPDVC